MQEFFPALLSRRQAMSFMNKGRKALENLIARHGVRTFKTKGGHNRYHKADLEKLLNTQTD